MNIFTKKYIIKELTRKDSTFNHKDFLTDKETPKEEKDSYNLDYTR